MTLDNPNVGRLRSLAPRRLRVRFTIRALFVLLTVLCLAMGVWTQRAWKQRAVVQSLGPRSQVFYDYQVLDNETFLPRESAVPRFLLDTLGVDYFHRVTGVSTFDAEVLPHLSTLNGLEELSIWDGTLTDEQLAPIGRLHRLKSLAIASDKGRPDPVQISDSSLVLLATLPELESLMIDAARITPAGLTELAKSKSLRNLEISTMESSVDRHAAEPFRREARLSTLKIRRLSCGSWGTVVAEW